MSAPAKAPPTETVDQQVDRLLKQWDDEIGYLSDSNKIQSHPALKKLVALDVEALPALFRYLDRTRDGHISPTLRAITGAQPIPAELHGRIGEIADVWLKWARENGYLK